MATAIAEGQLRRARPGGPGPGAGQPHRSLGRFLGHPGRALPLAGLQQPAPAPLRGAAGASDGPASGGTPWYPEPAALKALASWFRTRPAAAPIGHRGYAICTQPRSGSNLLCQYLSSTDRLGHPLEYFNGPARRALGMPDAPDDARGQIDLVLRRGATANGIYGVKLFAAQQHDRVAASVAWIRALPELRFVYLERRDLLGQALSWARATQTGVYRSSQRPAGAPAYDGALILSMLHEIVRERARWEAYFARHGHRAAAHGLRGRGRRSGRAGSPGRRPDGTGGSGHSRSSASRSVGPARPALRALAPVLPGRAPAIRTGSTRSDAPGARRGRRAAPARRGPIASARADGASRRAPAATRRRRRGAPPPGMTRTRPDRPSASPRGPESSRWACPRLAGAADPLEDPREDADVLAVAGPPGTCCCRGSVLIRGEAPPDRPANATLATRGSDRPSIWARCPTGVGWSGPGGGRRG